MGVTSQHTMKGKQRLSLTLHVYAPLLVPELPPRSWISHFPDSGRPGPVFYHILLSTRKGQAANIC